MRTGFLPRVWKGAWFPSPRPPLPELPQPLGRAAFLRAPAGFSSGVCTHPPPAISPSSPCLQIPRPNTTQLQSCLKSSLTIPTCGPQALLGMQRSLAACAGLRTSAFSCSTTPTQVGDSPAVTLPSRKLGPGFLLPSPQALACGPTHTVSAP